MEANLLKVSLGWSNLQEGTGRFEREEYEEGEDMRENNEEKKSDGEEIDLHDLGNKKRRRSLRLRSSKENENEE